VTVPPAGAPQGDESAVDELTDGCLAADLRTGDRLLALGGVRFAGPPVLVADVRPCAQDTVQVDTSSGVFRTAASAPAAAVRQDRLVAGGVLLISRRHSLHARLLADAAVPIVRRTPVQDGRSVPAVNADEWAQASLLVIDGYLAQSTLQRMRSRGDLPGRAQIVMVGTDPDDPSVYPRRALVGAGALAILPYDRAPLVALLRAASGLPVEDDTHPWLRLLDSARDLQRP
jgi:hypothetical protein